MKRQQSFQGKFLNKPKDFFGGSLIKGNPRKARPMDSKLPIHLVLKANESQMRLPTNFKPVNENFRRICKKHGVRLYEYANVGNHLHALLKIPGRRRWAAFIRELTGRIAQLVKTKPGKFWKFRPYTRVVQGWRKAFAIVREYIMLNELEGAGVIDRRQVQTLKDLHAIWGDG